MLNVLRHSEECLLPDSYPSRIKTFPAVSLEKWIFHFKVLCFRLSTAHQVFTMVFKLVSTWAYQQDICLLYYLDDWLVMVDSVP